MVSAFHLAAPAGGAVPSAEPKVSRAAALALAEPRAPLGLALPSWGHRGASRDSSSSRCCTQQFPVGKLKDFPAGAVEELWAGM